MPKLIKAGLRIIVVDILLYWVACAMISLENLSITHYLKIVETNKDCLWRHIYDHASWHDAISRPLPNHNAEHLKGM